MKKINFLTILLFLPLFILGQTDSVIINKILNEVNVNAVKADNKTPIAFTNLTKKEIQKSILLDNNKDTT